MTINNLGSFEPRDINQPYDITRPISNHHAPDVTQITAEELRPAEQASLPEQKAALALIDLENAVNTMASMIQESVPRSDPVPSNGTPLPGRGTIPLQNNVPLSGDDSYLGNDVLKPATEHAPTPFPGNGPTPFPGKDPVPGDSPFQGNDVLKPAAGNVSIQNAEEIVNGLIDTINHARDELNIWMNH